MDDDATGAEAEDEEYAEETEEEGSWEERGRKIEKGRNTGRRKKTPPLPHPRSWRKRRRCMIRIWAISSSSWAHPPRIRPCTCPPVPVMMNMLNSMERGYRNTAATATAVI